MSLRHSPADRFEEVVAAGQTALDSGRFEEAAHLFSAALRGRNSANDEALIRCRLSEALEKRGLNHEQLEAVAKYDDVSKQLRLPDNTQMLVLIRLGWAHSLLDDVPRAIALFNQAMRIARRINDDAGIGACHFGLGRAYRVVSEVRIARDHYISALEHYRKIGNWRELAESYINIGYVNAREGDYRNALHALRQALSIIGDRDEHDLIGRAYMYTAITYDNMDSTANAIAAFEKCLEHFQRAGNHLYLAINQNNFAAILILYGEWGRAEVLVRAAIELLKDSASLSTQGAAYDTLAQICLLRGDLDEAEKLLADALKLLSEIKTGRWNESSAQMTIGRCHLARGRPDLAVDCLRQAIDIASRLGDTQHLVPEARLWLAEAFLQQGHLEQARVEVDNVRGYLRQSPNLKVWGFLSRTASKIEAAEGHIAAAIQSLGQSSSIFEIRANTYARAVNRTVLAQLLEKMGRIAEAVKEVEAALEVFKHLSAAIDEAAANAQLQALQNSNQEHAAMARPRLDIIDLVSAIDGFIAKRLVEASVSRELLLYEAASITRDQAGSRAVVIAEVEDSDASPASLPSLKPTATVGLPDGEIPREMLMLSQLAPDQYPKHGVYQLGDPQQGVFLLHVIEPQSHRFKSGNLNLQPLFAMVEQGLETNLLRSKNRRARIFDPARLLAEVELPGFVCVSHGTRRVLERINKIRSSDVTVLITGESGTGKELVARAVHGVSSRRYNLFLPFNCSSISRDMIESQLFGYRKGSFTGAMADYEGIIRAANRGTLLLDEIGDLPLELQPKLLRFLQEGEIHPIGETRPIRVDVRVVAATNSDLERAVADGRFREDLFHRLNVIRLEIPPLRERREEIPPLVNHYLNLYQDESAKTEIKLTEEALDLMVAYEWPGNVRQLCNEIRRIIAYSESGTIVTPDMLSPQIARAGRQLASSISSQRKGAARFMPAPGAKISEAVDALERQMIAEALQRCSGNVAQAAKALGLSRKGLYLKMNRLNVKE